MSSIPLVATTIQQPTSPLDNAFKAASLGNMFQQRQLAQGEQQIQQQKIEQGQIAIQDQQALSAAQKQAYENWDGKDYRDLYAQLPKLAVKNGASFQAVSAIQQHLQQQQLQYSEMAKNDAQTGKDNIATLMQKNDLAVGQLNAIKALPDDRLAATLPQAIAQMAQQGLIDPQHAQIANQVSQLPPDQIRSEIDLFTKGLMSQSQQAKAAADAAGLAKTQADTANAQAELGGKQAASTNAQSALKDKSEWLFNHPGKNGADYDAMVAGKKAGAEASARVGPEESVAKFNFNLNRGLLPPELQTVAPGLVNAASSQYEKASTEYMGSKQAADDMQSLIGLAKSGNKLAYAYSPTTGVLTINSAHGVKRVNMAEISSYAGAGSALDRIQGWFGKQISGASIPDDILNDMAQAHETLQKNSEAKYGNQVQTINNLYGAKFKTQEYQSAPQAQPVYAKNPQTGARVMSSDGGKTWQPAQ